MYPNKAWCDDKPLIRARAHALERVDPRSSCKSAAVNSWHACQPHALGFIRNCEIWYPIFGLFWTILYCYTSSLTCSFNCSFNCMFFWLFTSSFARSIIRSLTRFSTASSLAPSVYHFFSSLQQFVHILSVLPFFPPTKSEYAGPMYLFVLQ